MQTDDRELKLAKRQPVASGSDSHHSAIRLGGSPTQQVRVSGGRIKNVSIRYTSIANLNGVAIYSAQVFPGLRYSMYSDGQDLRAFATCTGEGAHFGQTWHGRHQ